MNTPLSAKLAAALLRQSALLPAGARVGVAVSGGADSLALLLLLHELRAELGITLRVLHFNHQLRPGDADADETFVRAAAARLQLECTVARDDVRAAAEREGWNLEDAARRLRYRFFASVVASGAASRVATAHTADDQAETVLMHLLRGSGLAGLGGIHVQRGDVVRPLLALRRTDLREFLRERGETWREDVSNQDVTRTRARIRHTLLPLIESEFQTGAVERLAAFAQLARRENDATHELTEACFTALVQTADGAFDITAEDLLHPADALLPPGNAAASAADAALAARLARRMVVAAGGSAGALTADHVAAVLALAASPEGGKHLDLAGAFVEKQFGKLRFASAASAAPARTQAAAASYSYVVALPAASDAPALEFAAGGLRVRLKLFDCQQQGRDTKIGADSLDKGLLAEPLVLRNWQPGDSYRPLGRRGPHKLKRLFWEQRVPPAQRAAWPVMASNGKIVWAARFGVAHEFAVSESTRTGVQMIEDAD